MSKDFLRKETDVKQGVIDKSILDDDFKACGLDLKKFQAKYESVFVNFSVNPHEENPMAVLTELVENGFSKREIAFLVAKDISDNVIKEMKAEEEKNNN